jgi:hypothetical protein
MWQHHKTMGKKTIAVNKRLKHDKNLQNIIFHFDNLNFKNLISIMFVKHMIRTNDFIGV